MDSRTNSKKKGTPKIECFIKVLLNVPLKFSYHKLESQILLVNFLVANANI